MNLNASPLQQISSATWPESGNVFVSVDNAQTYLPWLYRHNPDPNPSLIFLGTELDPAKKTGPVLFSLSGEEDLAWLRSTAEKDDAISIMLYHTSLSQEELLNQLHHNLFVTFSGNKKGLLRFYDPSVASYLFQAPIEGHQFQRVDCIQWYGNRFCLLPEQGRVWWQYSCHPERGELKASTNSLNQKQSNALQILLQERLVYQQYQQHSQRFSFEHIEKELIYLSDILGFTQEQWITRALTLLLQSSLHPPELRHGYILSADREQQKLMRLEQVMSELSHE